jgi:hypothetical protein
MESLYPGQVDHIPPGSICEAIAYTDNSERLITEPAQEPAERLNCCTCPAPPKLAEACVGGRGRDRPRS